MLDQLRSFLRESFGNHTESCARSNEYFGYSLGSNEGVSILKQNGNFVVMGAGAMKYQGADAENAIDVFLSMHPNA